MINQRKVNTVQVLVSMFSNKARHVRMKNLLILIVFSSLSFYVKASGSSTPVSFCSGAIIQVLDWNFCEGHLAYKLSTSKGKWICSTSDKSDAMALSAFAMGRKISARLNDNPSYDKASTSCDDLVNYHKPSYVVLYNEPAN